VIKRVQRAKPRCLRLRPGSVLRVAGRLLVILVLTLIASVGQTQEVAGVGAARRIAMAGPTPGAIGATPPSQHAPRPSHFQSVTVEGPAGLLVAVETVSGWSTPVAVPLRMELPVGVPHRLRLTGIPGFEGMELFPSVRVLAKLDAPPADDWRFPVELVIDQQDLAEAMEGALVRRVVYSATDCLDADPPVSFDVQPGNDALDVAQTLGDPVLEFVVGNRVPSSRVLP
jgi:hypothetical protein